MTLFQLITWQREARLLRRTLTGAATWIVTAMKELHADSVTT